MAKGRKTGTPSEKGKYEVNWARNLPTNKLAAVIFGCKNHTIAECFDKEIFGLPAAHYSYVKNITPGLPLFLFNYSDRMLHGIFKAVSPGQMNISRHSWITSEGAESTPYPAQVRVCELRKCYPLPEGKFKHIIKNNYYEEKHFSFELDKGQYKCLSTLFLSPLQEKMPRPPSSLQERMPHPPNAAWKNNMFDALSSSSVTDTANEEFNNHSEVYSGTAETLQENEHSHALVGNRDGFTPNWAGLFKKTSFTSYALKNEETLEPEKIKITSSFDERSEQPIEACQESANTECDSNVVECWEDHVDNYLNETYPNEVGCSQHQERESEMTELTYLSSSVNKIFLDGDDDKLNHSDPDYVLDEKPGEELFDTNGVRAGISLAPQENCERDHVQPNLTARTFQEENSAASGGVFMAYISKLLKEVEGLKVSQLEQWQKIGSLERELVDSKLEINQLKNRCRKLEPMSCPARNYCNTEYSISNFTAEESVFIVGGFDGNSWLLDLSSYSPSEDHVISLCPMTFSRSHASVAKLNGELYIFGGARDGVWYDIVESYNPISNQWVQRPSLNRRKGSLSGASMYGKIFAIGGGNGVECFSEVELFDLYIGSWVLSQPMLEKRFAPAAADLNGALYVAGGYDGRYYLSTAERFDPREHAWTRVGDMNMKRGCHSLVAYKEKLYAIGGYNGDKMVPTVEVLDPRFGSWRMGAPLTISRGSCGSFVSGEKIYTIGGVQEGQILDVTECYTEESGWQMTGARALGKRSFFSTLVL
ncbi:hypothetical protein ACS0TY_001077 [Phlomoides rotata]